MRKKFYSKCLTIKADNKTAVERTMLPAPRVVSVGAGVDGAVVVTSTVVGASVGAAVVIGGIVVGGSVTPWSTKNPSMWSKYAFCQSRIPLAVAL